MGKERTGRAARRGRWRKARPGASLVPVAGLVPGPSFLLFFALPFLGCLTHGLNLHLSVKESCPRLPSTTPLPAPRQTPASHLCGRRYSGNTTRPQEQGQGFLSLLVAPPSTPSPTKPDTQPSRPPSPSPSSLHAVLDRVLPGDLLCPFPSSPLPPHLTSKRSPGPLRASQPVIESIESCSDNTDSVRCPTPVTKGPSVALLRAGLH